MKKHVVVIWAVWFVSVLLVVLCVASVVLVLYGLFWILDGPGRFMTQ